MAITSCAPCDCVPGNIPSDKFKQDVELILCEIASAIQGGGTANSAEVNGTVAITPNTASSALTFAGPGGQNVSVQVVPANTVTAFSIAVEVSIDGTTYTQIGIITDADVMDLTSALKSFTGFSVNKLRLRVLSSSGTGTIAYHVMGSWL